MFSEEFAGSLLQRPYDVDLGYGVWKPLPANTTSCACMFHKHGLWPVMHGILAAFEVSMVSPSFIASKLLGSRSTMY